MLYRPICNTIRRTVFSNRKIHYGLQNVLIVNFKPNNLCTNYLYPQNLNFITFKRFKSKEGSAKYDEDEEINEQSLEDEYLYTSKSKIIETTIPSLRLDVVAKAGLAMSRAFKLKTKLIMFKSKVQIIQNLY